MAQEELASRAGIAGGTLSLIESRQAGYSIETLDALAQILGVKAGELLDRDPADATGTWALAERLAKLPADQRERLILAAEMLAGRVNK